jgi:hypothetical protein
LQRIIGRPSTRGYLLIVETSQLPNCPIGCKDIAAAEEIFGPDLGTLKGKTVQRGGEHVRPTNIAIPATIVSWYRKVTITVDIMKVNKILFIMSISRNIKFGTNKMVPNMKTTTLLDCIKNIKAILLHAKRGFKVTNMMVDGQFETLRGELGDMQITLDTVSKDEHVPEIERYIRTVKERVRCIYNTLPFTRMSGKMIIEMVSRSVFWLNMFLPMDGVSTTISPRGLMVGLNIDYNKHCRLEFGEYAQVHEEHVNSMVTRTTGAIALWLTGNPQGGYYFLSLLTGRRLNCKHWTSLPMPAEVIDRVHVLARRSPPLGLSFADRDGLTTIEDIDDNIDDDDEPDDDYDPAEDPDIPDPEDEEMIDEAADGLIAGVEDEQEEEQIDETIKEQIDETIKEQIDETLDDNQPTVDEEMETTEVETVDEEMETTEAADEATATEDTNSTDAMDVKYGPRSGKHNLRRRKKVDFSHAKHGPRVGKHSLKESQRDHSQLHAMFQKRLGLRDYARLHVTLHNKYGPMVDIMNNPIVHAVLSQYSVKRGLKLFGEDGTNAVLKELKQQHDRKVLEPEVPTELTRDQKQKALQYLMRTIPLKY